MKRSFYWILAVLTIPLSQCKRLEPPKPVLPLPTETQVQWNEMERNAFIHFGLNTFNDMEWGYGDTPSNTFNPSELDVNQWCEVIKKSGFKGCDPHGKKWQKQSSGEFSNIRNHPVWQKKLFKPVIAKYVKLRAIANINGDQKASYTEFNIITE
jgi:hypothetical protein